MQDTKSIKGFRQMRNGDDVFDDLVAGSIVDGHRPNAGGFQEGFDEPGDGGKFLHVDVEVIAF